MQHICETLLSENYDDANKMNAMKTCLARSDPIMKQDIWTCERIGISDPCVVLLGSSNDTKVLYLFRASEVGESANNRARNASTGVGVPQPSPLADSAAPLADCAAPNTHERLSHSRLLQMVPKR
jgi:hypothetical protein